MPNPKGITAGTIFSLPIIRGYVLYESRSIYENDAEWWTGDHCSEATDVKGRFLDSGRLIVALKVVKAALSSIRSVGNPFSMQTLR